MRKSLHLTVCDWPWQATDEFTATLEEHQADIVRARRYDLRIELPDRVLWWVAAGQLDGVRGHLLASWTDHATMQPRTRAWLDSLVTMGALVG